MISILILCYDNNKIFIYFHETINEIKIHQPDIAVKRTIAKKNLARRKKTSIEHI